MFKFEMSPSPLSNLAVRTRPTQKLAMFIGPVTGLFFLFGAVVGPRIGPTGRFPWLDLTVPAANAQVLPDSTLSTTVTSTDNLNFVIEGGDRPSRGSRSGPNLFHSFDTFSVPDGGSARFNNPPDITHIIGRVTGSQPSIIEGLISAQGEANLFLINPQGILFGPNAQLDIGGSFLASTVDRIVFQDGAVFSASDPSLPLLTVSVPAGLQMGSTPQSIHNQSQVTVNDSVVGLMVAPKETVGLVGGAIALEAIDSIGVESLNSSVDATVDALVDVPDDTGAAVLMNGTVDDVTSSSTGGDLILLSESELPVQSFSPTSGSIFCSDCVPTETDSPRVGWLLHPRTQYNVFWRQVKYIMLCICLLTER